MQIQRMRERKVPGFIFNGLLNLLSTWNNNMIDDHFNQATIPQERTGNMWEIINKDQLSETGQKED